MVNDHKFRMTLADDGYLLGAAVSSFVKLRTAQYYRVQYVYTFHIHYYYTHTHTRMHTHTYMHTRTHTYIHTCTHTYTHTHTHTYTHTPHICTTHLTYHIYHINLILLQVTTDDIQTCFVQYRTQLNGSCDTHSNNYPWQATFLDMTIIMREKFDKYTLTNGQKMDRSSKE